MQTQEGLSLSQNNAVGAEAEIGFVPTNLCCGNFLLVLQHIVYQCVSFGVFHPTDPSKEFFVNLPPGISTFIGFPRSMYMDVKDRPT